MRFTYNAFEAFQRRFSVLFIIISLNRGRLREKTGGRGHSIHAKKTTDLNECLRLSEWAANRESGMIFDEIA